MGHETMAALNETHVMVVGLGGVGSWAAEALVRSGIGKISLVDSDRVCISNINRQVEAVNSTVGRLKTEALGERLLDINPSCSIKTFPELFTKENTDLFDIPGKDYVIDAIDTMPHKLDLIEAVYASGKCLFSSMGMALKLDPALIKTADIWDTSGCPLARIVRQGLLKRNFNGHFTAVFSIERITPPENLIKKKTQSLKENMKESPIPRQEEISSSPAEPEKGKRPMGSAVTVTATAGMILANLVIRDVYSRYAPPSGGRENG